MRDKFETRPTCNFIKKLYRNLYYCTIATCTCKVTGTKPVILIWIGSIMGITKLSDISTRCKILVMIAV